MTHTHTASTTVVVVATKFRLNPTGEQHNCQFKASSSILLPPLLIVVRE